MLRLIKQLVELLARALKLARGGKKEEAAELVESGALTLLGVDFKTLSMVDASSAADLLGSSMRIVVFIRLLDGLREVAEAGGDEAMARSRAQHGCEMCLELLRRHPAHAEGLAFLETFVPHVDVELLPDRLQPIYRTLRAP